MPVVRVILREGHEKVYYEAQASIHTPDRTLRITRNQDSIAEFQSEYSQYWEYVEDMGQGTGEAIEQHQGERRADDAERAQPEACGGPVEGELKALAQREAQHTGPAQAQPHQGIGEVFIHFRTNYTIYTEVSRRYVMPTTSCDASLRRGRDQEVLQVKSRGRTHIRFQDRLH
jgi:hypothetical protein